MTHIGLDSIGTNTSENISVVDSMKENGNMSIEVQEQYSQENLNFTIKLSTKYKVCIYKPLLPLKAVLFLWYGAGSFVIPFITVYFKQRGISLKEITAAVFLSPIMQFIGTMLSGIIADKIGKSKPVLVANIILSSLLVMGILLMPSLNNLKCVSQAVHFTCDANESDRFEITCHTTKDVQLCTKLCSNNTSNYCEEQNRMCDISVYQDKFGNLSFYINESVKLANKCNNVSYTFIKNEILTNVKYKTCCSASCHDETKVDCSNDVNYRDIFMMITVTMYILFLTTYSSTYRCLDVTSMFLVKEHNSSFGRERFFSIVGILVISPIAGYLVDATSANEDNKNIDSALYLFIAINIIVLCVIYRLVVQVNPPGKKMIKKTFKLFKNPDVISFALIVLALGTGTSFKTYYLFWYLEELKASSMLMGLIPAIGALYGLPFLLTSKWWVAKFGTRLILISGLLGYVVNYVGYSFLSNPWLSLILEATEVLTYHLLWVAVVMHSHELAPEGLAASVISLAGSIHFQIGKLTGSAIGGSIMDAFGGVMAFRVFAVIFLAFAFIYVLYLFIRQKYFNEKLEVEKIKGKHNEEKR